MKKRLYLSAAVLFLLAVSFIHAAPVTVEMECGWNLGNTLDARDNWTKKFPLNQGLKSETCWGEVQTTEAVIKAGIENGYKTIRIPVTWTNHIIDKDYTIDPKWMARVKQLVDWSINAGYYVILDEHHSVQSGMNSPLQHCEGYIVRSQDEKESKAFLEAVWKQICGTFNNDYDEHLIFETMNEPRNAGHEHEWMPRPDVCKECKADVKLLNEYNQLILNTIRASGGNNAKRYVLIPSMGTGIDAALADFFALPEDSVKGRLMVTVHLYPLDSGGTGRGSHHFDASTKNEIISKMKLLNEKFVCKGIPVVLGECGASRKGGTYWENGVEKKIKDYVVTADDRLECFKFLSAQAGKYSIPMINWDVGGYDGMATIDRKKATVYEKDYVQAVTKAWKNANENPGSVAAAIENEDVAIYLLKVWDNSVSSFDSKTGLLKLGSGWKGADIWFGAKDVSSFKNLEVTYSASTNNLQCWIAYADGTESSRVTLKASKAQVTVKIKLDSTKAVKQICIMDADKPASVIMEKISFSEK